MSSKVPLSPDSNDLEIIRREEAEEDGFGEEEEHDDDDFVELPRAKLMQHPNGSNSKVLHIHFSRMPGYLSLKKQS
jgi:hypothetical protein